MSYHVYLAGPISGCTYEECVGWREDFLRSMPSSIKCLSPMRGKTSRGSTCRESTDSGSVQPDKSDRILRTDAAIMARDFFDCTRADVIVFNFLNTTRVSVGTCMEVAWGYAKHTPMVFIMKKGDFHDHPMIRACGGFWCETLEEAKNAVLAVLDVDNVGHDQREIYEMRQKLGMLDPRAGDPL